MDGGLLGVLDRAYKTVSASSSTSLIVGQMTRSIFLDAFVWVVLHSPIEYLLRRGFVFIRLELGLEAVRCGNVDERSRLV